MADRFHFQHRGSSYQRSPGHRSGKCSGITLLNCLHITLSLTMRCWDGCLAVDILAWKHWRDLICPTREHPATIRVPGERLDQIDKVSLGGRIFPRRRFLESPYLYIHPIPYYNLCLLFSAANKTPQWTREQQTATAKRKKKRKGKDTSMWSLNDQSFSQLPHASYSILFRFMKPSTVGQRVRFSESASDFSYGSIRFLGRHKQKSEVGPVRIDQVCSMITEEDTPRPSTLCKLRI